MTVMTEGPEVVRVEHQSLHLDTIEGCLRRDDVMHLAGRRKPVLFLAPLAQRMSREDIPAKAQPSLRVDELPVCLVLRHGYGLPLLGRWILGTCPG